MQYLFATPSTDGVAAFEADGSVRTFDSIASPTRRTAIRWRVAAVHHTDVFVGVHCRHLRRISERERGEDGNENERNKMEQKARPKKGKRTQGGIVLLWPRQPSLSPP